MKKLIIISAIALAALGCRHTHYVYQAHSIPDGLMVPRSYDEPVFPRKQWPLDTVEIGSEDPYMIGDTVLVDETNFVDMDDKDGTPYVIFKALPSVPVVK